MEILTIMSVTEITRYGDKFEIKDGGLKGYTYEYIRLEYYSDFGYPYVKFRCFDDYSKFFYIDCSLHFLYSENCDLRTSLIRDDERLFYNNLNEVQKIVDYFKNMEIEHQCEVVFYKFFRHIDNFISEY